MIPLRSNAAPSRARNWWLITGVLIIYAATMAVYFPDVITNIDESCYVAQANSFAQGTVRTHWKRPILELPKPYQPGEYPPGTSALMAPFVFLFGWRGAFLVPLLGLLGLVLLTARWIELEGKPILYSLLVLLYPAALVLGRVAMSDVICALFTTISIVLFWAGADRGDKTCWWISGFFAGLSLAFRETSVLVIVPFYLGALLRRERGTHSLIISGVVGVLVRLLGGWVVFGEPLHLKNVGFGFSFSSFVANLQLYAFLTMILVPGGLLAGCLYRGRRRPEIVTSSLLLVSFFVFYGYAAHESGWLKAVILTGRFLIPVVPVLAFSLAHVVPDLLEQLSERAPRLATRLEVAGGTLLVTGAVVASIAVHVVMDQFNSSQLKIRNAIYEFTDEDSWVITNAQGTFKYLENDLYGERTPIGIRGLRPFHYDLILERATNLHLVLLERSDSEYWVSRGVEYAKSIGELTTKANMEVRYDEHVTPVDHLRIWRLTRKSDTPP